MIARNLAASLLLLASAAPASAIADEAPSVLPNIESSSPESGYNPVNGRAVSWDLNLSGGFLRGFDQPDHGDRVSSFAMRAQTGAMFVRGSWFYGGGPFIDHATSFAAEGANTSFGLLGYFSDAQAGGWIELGMLRSSSPSLGFLAGTGLGIFGFELQTRKRFEDGASRDWYGLFKLRIPVSALIFLIRN